MHGTYNTSKRSVTLVLTGGLVGAFVLFMAIELYFHRDEMSFEEFLFEILEFGFVVGIASGIIYLAQQVETARAQSRIWQNEARLRIDGLQSAIPRQFESWGMTKAEEEVGVLILKGFSHKKIANSRGTSEATVRQQAQSIYEKSGLHGKAALLSFFLEGPSYDRSDARGL
jgi:DNA-binding NarL/FixJ family response regulator